MTEDSYCYDKAKYHFDGDFPKDLPLAQAYVHTGLFLGWLIDHNLCSDFFVQEAKEDIEQFKKRQLTGPQIYEHWDGCLISEMLSEQGNRFAAAYFDFEHGQFLADYEKLFCSQLPSLYHVKDTWENYDKLAALIDQRYKVSINKHELKKRQELLKQRLSRDEQLKAKQALLSELDRQCEHYTLYFDGEEEPLKVVNNLPLTAFGAFDLSQARDITQIQFEPATLEADLAGLIKSKKLGEPLVYLIWALGPCLSLKLRLAAAVKNASLLWEDSDDLFLVCPDKWAIELQHDNKLLFGRV